MENGAIVNKELKEYTIIIDKQVIERYNKHYFLLHPRARKEPIPQPYHPSVNTWGNLQRQQKNVLKQKWKDFIVWLIKIDTSYENINLENFIMKYTFYMPTKRAGDHDNYTPKFIQDGLVEAGVIKDDCNKYQNLLIIDLDYDKNNPRTEIKIYENAKIQIQGE